MNYLTFGFILIFFLAFFTVLEFVKRKFKTNSEYTRKFAHVFGGLAVIVFSGYINRFEYLLLTIFFLLFFIVSHKKKLLYSFSAITRESYGEITYLLGLTILGIIFFDQKNIFIPSLLILIFPDAIAGLIGYQIRKERKTLAGSFIYFVVALVILINFFPLSSSLIMSIILSFTEFISPLGLDNLTVPLVFSLLMII